MKLNCAGGYYQDTTANLDESFAACYHDSVAKYYVNNAFMVYPSLESIACLQSLRVWEHGLGEWMTQYVHCQRERHTQLARAFKCWCNETKGKGREKLRCLLPVRCVTVSIATLVLCKILFTLFLLYESARANTELF